MIWEFRGTMAVQRRVRLGPEQKLQGEREDINESIRGHVPYSAAFVELMEVADVVLDIQPGYRPITYKFDHTHNYR